MLEDKIKTELEAILKAKGYDKIKISGCLEWLAEIKNHEDKSRPLGKQPTQYFKKAQRKGLKKICESYDVLVNSPFLNALVNSPFLTLGDISKIAELNKKVNFEEIITHFSWFMENEYTIKNFITIAKRECMWDVIENSGLTTFQYYAIILMQFDLPKDAIVDIADDKCGDTRLKRATEEIKACLEADGWQGGQHHAVSTCYSSTVRTPTVMTELKLLPLLLHHLSKQYHTFHKGWLEWVDEEKKQGSSSTERKENSVIRRLMFDSVFKHKYFEETRNGYGDYLSKLQKMQSINLHPHREREAAEYTDKSMSSEPVVSSEPMSSEPSGQQSYSLTEDIPSLSWLNNYPSVCEGVLHEQIIKSIPNPDKDDDKKPFSYIRDAFFGQGLSLYDNKNRRKVDASQASRSTNNP